MKKKTSAFYFGMIFSIIACVGLYAQNGYKDYTWGMTITQIRARCGDIEETNAVYWWYQPSFAVLSFYEEEIKSTVPDPLEYEKREILSCESAKNGLVFYFVDSKLAAVELHFDEEGIYNELVKQYGEISIIHTMYRFKIHKTSTWLDNRNRIIIWDYPQDGIETVTYVDASWLAPLIDKAISAHRKEKESVTSRLD